LKTSEKIILGIDPGTTLMGYGVVLKQKEKLTMVTMGIIDLKKFTDHYVKLKKIFERVVFLIDEFHPDELSIEAPFFGKNVQSMLKLGRAQGVAIAAALSREMPIFEYAPRKIKQAITGNGNASKEQVAGMLKGILHMKEMPEHLDTTDGLAAAVCHSYQSNVMNPEKSFNSWKDFINKHPNRVKD
jgi:crossover junction endodeoxyribonuclease RuvC